MKGFCYGYIPTPRNALDNALHRYMYGDHGRGLSGKHVHLEDKAIKEGHEMAGNLWDAADRKLNELLGINQLIEKYGPLYEGAEEYVKRELSKDPANKGIDIKERLANRRTYLAEEFTKRLKGMEITSEKRISSLKEIVYTYKEQVNKVYMLERAEKMADKQFLRQLAVATTKFLAVDGPGQSRKP